MSFVLKLLDVELFFVKLCFPLLGIAYSDLHLNNKLHDGRFTKLSDLEVTVHIPKH